MARFLFGPADDSTFMDRFLKRPVECGTWRTFPTSCRSWDEAVSPYSRSEWPEALLLWPGYQSAPAWVWSVPVPVVALAHDPNLLWHGYRYLLPLADLVLTDAPSAERLLHAGVANVRAANLYGLDRHFLAEIDTPEIERDIDVLFVGNLNPSVQSARLPWLRRLASLADRYCVRVRMGVFGTEYRELLRRAKLVFNHSVRGECNLRTFEAAASGAVLLQEANNREVREYLEPGSEYAPYASDDLEGVIARLLGDPAERAGIASRAKARVRTHGFDTLIEAAIDTGGPEWAAIRERAVKRATNPPPLTLPGRVWMRASLNGPDADSALAEDLRGAGDAHALALWTRSPAEAEPLLAQSALEGNRVSALGRASALADLGRRGEAVTILHELLANFEARPGLSPSERETVPYPPRFDHLRVGWERGAFNHSNDPAAEDAAKIDLLKCRAASLLATLTGELAVYEAAAAAGPEVPVARAALGCALARTGRFAEAVPHLRYAVEHNPFDHAAASALEAALADSGDITASAALRSSRRLLALAAPGLVPDPGPGSHPQVPAPAPPRGPRRTRFFEVEQDEFAKRFGSLDTSRALTGFTPPHDTRAVLTLLAHVLPRRLLEIGTAAGHMTANLTTFSPLDAVVYSLGVVAEDGVRSGTTHQDYEVPRRDQFARFLNHFGTAHKAMLITADSRTYDFARLAPLDFAFIDGGHDLATVKSDSLGAYQALRPGGCLVWHDLPSKTPWVEVERAVSELGFLEPVYKLQGTEVAFLLKGEGVGAKAGPETARVEISWEGEFAAVHSLAAVNRAVCSELVSRGHDVALVTDRARPLEATPFVLPPVLASRLRRQITGSVVVRHHWPPDFTPPAGEGPFVLVQPWEFGRLPAEWLSPIIERVDEVWVPSRSVLRAYVASGVPEERLAVVPNGVDPDVYRPGLAPLPLPTTKSVKLLFVGGTLPRKGFDVLLTAYRRAFTTRDDVALVVKDMGVGTFYRGQTAGPAIELFRMDPDAPEIVYLPEDLSEQELARLYAACDALVHPYRGEGFGLPVLEAMASGKPVVVTAGGPTDEFVPASAGWHVPAELKYFPEEKVGDMATAGRPWWIEPDVGALAEVLRTVVGDARERHRRGEAARRAALGWTWARTAAVVEDRVRVLRTRTPLRHRRPADLPAHAHQPDALEPDRSTLRAGAVAPADRPLIVPAMPRDRPRVSLTMIVRNEEKNLPDCLASVRDLVDEAVVVDTGSTDRTREVARSFGAVLAEFPWVDDFATARNVALDHATGDYAFWMDADDRIDEENRQKLRALFAGLSGGNEAYVVKCLCVPDKPGAGATVVDHVRVFRHTPAHRWTYRVHEQILPALRSTGADVRWSGVSVQHVGYVDAAVRRRKLDRDLRLLKLDEHDRPNDPFTLFNLGSVFNELGDHKAAAEALQRSLAGSHPRDSIVRKLYAMITQCHSKAGDRARAIATCEEGRTHYPEDAELLFLAAGLARESRDYRGAEDLYRRLIAGKEGDHFASVDVGLRAIKGRHNLAVLLMETNRPAEAEGLWRAALSAEPHFLPAHAGLGDLYIRTGNEPGLIREVAAIKELGPDGEIEAAVLESRRLGKRGDHAAALAVLQGATEHFPTSPALRLALSHVRLADGSPPEVIEAALNAVLEVDPANPQARHNMQVLLRNTGRSIEGVIDDRPMGA